MKVNEPPIGPYPPRSAEIEQWASAHGHTIAETERRFCLYAAVCSIANDPELNRDLILRGSGALWLAYGLTRAPAADLDFISRQIMADRSTDAQREHLARRINAALSRGLRSFVDDFDARKDRLLEVVRVEVSPFYMPVGIRRQRLEPQHDLYVVVPDLEYLLAEKLIALIRQMQRPNKTRSQDPFDIAVMLQWHGSKIDRAKTAEYVRRGVEWDRGAPVCLSAFTPEVKLRTEAAHGNPAAADTPRLISFHDAWDRTLSFVAELDQHLTS